MSQTSNRPGKYQRTTSGLIGAMLVLVVATIGFVLFRDTFRHSLNIEPESVDYLAAVAAAQSSDPDLAYPSLLPSGWIATSVKVTQGDVPEWRLGLLTDEGKFVGLHSNDEPVADAVGTYVDPDATETESVSVPSEVATTWRVFTDTGGDTAYVAELEDRVVMVYGSAPRADLERLIKLLTQAALDPT